MQKYSKALDIIYIYIYNWYTLNIGGNKFETK